MARCLYLSMLLLVLLPAVVTAARKKRTKESPWSVKGPSGQTLGHAPFQHVEEGKLPDSPKCIAHDKCRHLEGHCCPDKSGLMLDCCSAEPDEPDGKEGTKPAKGGKGNKHELKGRVRRTKDKGGTRDPPSEKMERFAEKLGMSEEWKEAASILKSAIKNRTDAANKAREAMTDLSKDEKKFHKATVREKKGMLAAMLREMFENYEEEKEGDASEDDDDDDTQSKRKQKHMTLKKGKAQFLKFFEPSSGKAKDCLKDDIDIIEPAEDAEGTHVELGKKSIYCSMEEGEVCTIIDDENNETIRIEKKSDESGEFLVTRDGYLHDCGSHNKVDTTCGWDTSHGTRYLDFGSALLSADEAGDKSSSNDMTHLAALSLLVAACALLL